MSGEQRTKPAVSQTGYKVSLLRVAPGKEQEVARKTESAIIAQTKRKAVKVLKLFGRFDLCAIYRTSDYEAGPSKSGPIAGIRGANKILAFNWTLDGKDEKLQVESGRGDVWAISFFRFNEDLLGEAGARIETALAAHWLKDPPPDVSMSVLGTTGWAEILLILRAETFKAIAGALDNISNKLVYIGHGEQKKVRVLPSKTLSFFGIDYKLVSSAKKISQLPKRLPERFQADEGIFPRLGVTCKAASMDTVRAYSEKYFESAAVFYGVTDLVFTPKNGVWGELIQRVLLMRSSLGRNIYSTSIGVLVKPKRVAKASAYLEPKKTNRFQPLTISPSLAKLLKAAGPHFETRVTSLYFGLINLMHDPVIGSCFVDLTPFAKHSLKALLAATNSGDENLEKLRDCVVDVFHYGIEERAHGAFLSLEQLENSLSPTKGGIQRVLTAASIIPRTLLARVGKSWKGFLVAGYFDEFFNSHYDIINLPVEYLFHPEEWIGTFHETGHVAIFAEGLVNMDGRPLTSTLKKGLEDPSPEQYELWHYLAFEVGADMFDLYFCYGANIEEYFRNAWPFIRRVTQSLEERHFVRSFLTYLYSKYLLNGHTNKFHLRLSVKAEVSEFRQRLSRWELSQEVPGMSQAAVDDSANLGFEVLGPIIEQYHERYSKVGRMKDLDKELSSAVMRRQLETVIRGEVVLDKITNPDTFLLGLKRHKRISGGSLPLSVRLAAILSLWNTSVKVAGKE